MLKIAICDNERIDMLCLLDLVALYLGSHPDNQGIVVSFYNSRKLAECISAGTIFDIYMLDILMPDMNGIEIGRLLREKVPDAPIIYITSSEEFALNAFENHAIRYLVKPIARDELDSALDLAFSLCVKEKPTVYAVKTKEGEAAVPAEKIIYIENRLRTAVYVLECGKTVESVRIRSSFEDTVAVHDDPNFMQPHKSFFVNMNHIQVMTNESITMDNGQSVPISRGFKKSAEKQYLDFVSDRNGVLK